MKEEKIKVQTSILYHSYGKFAIEFEQMCLNIRTCITFALHANGLKEQRLVRILLADQTAYPLIAKLKSIIAIHYSEEPAVIKHLAPIFKFCININQQRNDIIHGSWFVGWESQDQKDFNIAVGMKDKITSIGIKLDELSYEHVDFDHLTDKIIIAKDLFLRLSGCIGYGLDVLKSIDSKQIEKLVQDS